MEACTNRIVIQPGWTGLKDLGGSAHFKLAGFAQRA